jgi:hypothetical protein
VFVSTEREIIETNRKKEGREEEIEEREREIRERLRGTGRSENLKPKQGKKKSFLGKWNSQILIFS